MFVLLGLALLLIFAGLASCAPVAPDFSNISQKINAELNAFKYQGVGFGSVSSYWLFIDGRTEPIIVMTEYIEFIYSPDVVTPRAEIIQEAAYGIFKARVYLKDRKQFLEYLR